MKYDFKFEFDGFNNKIVYSIGTYHLYIEDDYICELKDYTEYTSISYQDYWDKKFNFKVPSEIIGVYKDRAKEFLDTLIIKIFIKNCDDILVILEDIYEFNYARWFRKKFDELIIGTNYQDNFRIALKTDELQIKKYKEQQEHGCCGFFDEEVLCPIDNKIYLMGFNYGH